MKLRKELYNIAKKVNEEKKSNKEEHYVLAAEYLKEVLKKAAESGKFSCIIIPTQLNDGANLTDSDIKRFAEENDLDYYGTVEPYYPSLSFSKRGILERGIFDTV